MVPISVLLIPFALFTAGVIAYGFLTTWNLYRFGGEFLAYVATFLFWALTATVLFLTWMTLSDVDWTRPLLELGVFTAPSF